jgi:uncharacterized membrane protein
MGIVELIVTVILVLLAIACFIQAARSVDFNNPLDIKALVIALIWVLAGVLILSLTFGGLPAMSFHR